MTEEQEQIKDWRKEISEPQPTLKVQDGQSVVFVFLNEGEKRTHADFGTSIVFLVEHDGEKKNLYVRDTNYDLQRQIKALGDLTNLKANLSRIGSKKSDTRYTIEKVEDKD